MVSSIESTVKFAKRAWLVIDATPRCVTRRMIMADLDFKQQFDSMYFRLGL